MPNVGDTIQVTISGGESGVTLGGGGASIGLGAGASMSVPGVIEQDQGTHWLVRLSISLDGRNLVQVPKTG